MQEGLVQVSIASMPGGTGLPYKHIIAGLKEYRISGEKR